MRHDQRKELAAAIARIEYARAGCYERQTVHVDERAWLYASHIGDDWLAEYSSQRIGEMLCVGVDWYAGREDLMLLYHEVAKSKTSSACKCARIGTLALGAWPLRIWLAPFERMRTLAESIARGGQ